MLEALASLDGNGYLEPGYQPKLGDAVRNRDAVEGRCDQNAVSRLYLLEQQEGLKCAC